MDEAWRIGLVARRMAETFLQFCGSPVVLVIEIANHSVVKPCAGRNYRVNPLNTTMPCEIGCTGKRGPLMAAAPGQRRSFPLAQPRRAERGQQVTHIPIIIVPSRLLKSIHILHR